MATKRLTSSIRRPWRWFSWLFSRCQCCGRLGAETYHQNTRYEDHEQNIVTLCPSCKRDNDQYWADRWSELYGGW